MVYAHGLTIVRCLATTPKSGVPNPPSEPRLRGDHCLPAPPQVGARLGVVGDLYAGTAAQGHDVRPKCEHAVWVVFR